MKRLLILNGSPRAKQNTYQALMVYAKYLKKRLELTEEGIIYKQIPVSLQGCLNCSSCSLYCKIKDEFQTIVKELEQCDYLLLGSPVYLDMPTAQTVAFLTRLNCMAENTNREFFKNKQVFLLATSYCSGTKTVIHSMMGACEMLGFTIAGRSTREYIALWKDKKLRGGMNPKTDAVIIE